MMKICHVLSGDLWAGKEVVVYHLAMEMLSRRDPPQVSFILFNKGRVYEELKSKGLTVHVVDERRYLFPCFVNHIGNILKSIMPDVVHAHGYKENISAYLASSVYHRCEIVGTLHGMPEVCDKSEMLKQYLMKRINSTVLKRFSAVTVVSQDLKNLSGEVYRIKRNAHVIRNGIAIPEDELLERKRPGFVIGSSGRICPVKDFSFFVDVARAVHEREGKVCFHIAGEGPEKQILEDKIRQYALSQTIACLGEIQNMDQFYRDLSVYLNTSNHEGIPMSVLEAMSYGIPVVAAKVGGLPEMIEDGVDGYLVPKEDVDGFVDKCLLLFRDEALRERISKKAREKVQLEYSAKKMATEYYELYEHILRRQSERPGKNL